MKKMLNIRTAVGVLCVVLALALALKPKTNTVDNDLSILNIEKPTPSILEAVLPISKIITDPTDRAKLAIFNQEFAKRVPSYDADTQLINDVYVCAASNFFENTMKDKYDDLDVKIMRLIESITSSENHKLTPEEKAKLSENFLGLSWSLIQK